MRLGRRPVSWDKENRFVPGYDVAGVVLETGSSVSKFNVGDEVFYCGAQNFYGAYARYNTIDSRVVAHKPKSISWTEAAALPLTTQTAWNCLSDRMRIPENKEENKGKVILITAGAGGVGSMAIQIAKVVHGLTVIASASRKDTEAYCKKCGADYVINHRNDLGQELAKIGFKEVDYVFHCWEMTNEYAKQLSQVSKPYGTIGLLTAIEPINLSVFFPKNLTLAFEVRNPALKGDKMTLFGDYLENVAKYIEEGKMFSNLSEVKPFTLENIKEAHKRLEEGNIIGKLVYDKIEEFDE